MQSSVSPLRRFLYSHYFFGGVRQAIGMLLPVMIMGWYFGEYRLGMVATFGAQCLAIIDQPGGPQRHLPGEMLIGAALSAIAVALTGLVSTYPTLLWLAVIVQCFFLSMFTVYGRRGSLIGFGALLLMTLTMHTPLSPSEVLGHTAATLGGALFYFCFSILSRHLMMLRAERQSLSAALFDTASYIAVRASFYDETTDLDEAYRQLIRSQSAMTEKHQSARDNVLRALPTGRGRNEADKIMMWNMFVDMLQLRDTLVATHTDYTLLRRALAGHDALIFMRDALKKMALEIDRIALDVSRAQPTRYRNSAKAELLAIEYEIERLRQRKEDKPDPEVFSLMIQVLRRLRNAARIVDRMADHTSMAPGAQPTSDLRIDKSLTRFMTRQRPNLGMIFSNLRLDSPHCRYAIRVSLAAALGMIIIGSWSPSSDLSAHSYWVLLTIIIIMKPGFALTRQRNVFRLVGTLAGCVLAPAMFLITTKPPALFAMLLFACIMGNSLVQLNYIASSLFNTLYVVLVFHFASPDTVSLEVISERALDTMLGCALALACSYVLPWWESRSMQPLAQAATQANRDYLRAGLRYLRAMQTLRSGLRNDEGACNAGTVGDASDAGSMGNTEATDADLAWRLARKNVHTAFGNFAEAFYRMMSEPRSHQAHVPELNHLLIQNHILASQTTSVIPLLSASKAAIPAGMTQALEGMTQLLDTPTAAPAPQPTMIEAEGELASLVYPMKQMLRASDMIRHELASLSKPGPG